jgi:glycosidase
MEFHISRAIRDQLAVEDLLFSYTGNVVFANLAASRKVAHKLNEARGAAADPSGAINGGALFGMGLIDELNHALVARYRKQIDPAALTDAMRFFAAQIGPTQLEALLLKFADEFPNVEVYRAEQTAAEWLQGSFDGLPNREAALEELMLLWLANINPAFKPFNDLFDDSGLRQQTAYPSLTSALPAYFDSRPPVAPQVGSLWHALTAPMLASPDSLTGQLDFMREHWSEHIGTDLKQVLLAIDVIREEDIAVWMRFHPPGVGELRHGAQAWGAQGFVGDEYVGFDPGFDGGGAGFPGGISAHRRYAEDYQAPLVEYEAFSADQAWMPNVVLMAKSTYVWLEQLSKKYGRHIQRLDQIPDEELRLLAERGITGLWLIGLWERSTASRTIKRLRGHADAVASAYSLKGYEIAEDLGGNPGYESLKHRAAAAGLRLASDMVPNHMGIDSDWVIEHPDWFVLRDESPFPVYTFEGPDLSSDSRVEIKIEDHYYTQTDAAVVFRLRHHADGRTRFLYHGNDGTTFAWNDTAQLDYSQAMVREHVIQTILHVARLFPIIRFDAAMVLAKRHVQRLWFPLPGAGGSIPSRAENAMSQEQFDALMPHEFWREVVDRVAVEVPGTLLLAEAFWLLEGYFVRTLGMHRVYNSAFMNMLRDEENAKYRSYLKKTIEFDPDILKRYVNFMSNPDERTAIDQFGNGDKYLGVATLLATLPGLPMFGHGQIEGFTERYGMEYKQAKMNESPDARLEAQHQSEIAPLLKNRRIFAESEHFLLYDFWNDHGKVDENVFAYSNRLGTERSIVLYNNTYERTRGTIHLSVLAMDKASGEMCQRTLSEGLAVPFDDAQVMAYRDAASGLEHLRRATDLHRTGLGVELGGYQRAVLLAWRELRSTAEQPWDRLCDELAGAGVPSLDTALQTLRLRPLHQALRAVVSAGNSRVLAQLAAQALPTQPVALPASQPASQPAAKTTAHLAGSSNQDPSEPVVKPAVEAATEPLVEPVIKTATAPASETKPEPTSEPLVPKPATSEPAPPDPLRGLLDQAQAFAHRVADTLAAESAASLPFDAASFRTDLLALIQLPARTVGWSATSRALLPALAPDWAIERSWAPVLGWLLLRDLTSHQPATSGPTDLFERWGLRAVLAEIFATLGLHGDDRWRAAARVRILLAYPGTAHQTLASETFWADSEVRWLTGINESDGAAYVNQEQFEEMYGWLQIPAILAAPLAATGTPTEPTPTPTALLATANYRLDLFLNLMQHPTVPESPTVASNPPPLPLLLR